MALEFTEFGGVVPRITAPERLPAAAAQIARNVDLSGGTLKPIAVDGPLVAMHSGGQLVSGIPSGDVVSIPKPDAPSVNAIAYRCQPAQWPFRIIAYDWVSYIDLDGVRQVSSWRGYPLTISNIVYTEEGMWVIAILPGVIHTFAYNPLTVYYLRGPRYQFVLYTDADSGNVYGGPDTTFTLPALPTEADPEFPRQPVPLVDPYGNVYAQFQCVDVLGPNYDADILVRDYNYVTYLAPAYGTGRVAFHIDLNYTIPNRRHFYYVQSMVNAADLEGPPSEISQRVTLRPGQALLLNTPFKPGYSKNMLYRSTTGHDDFLRAAQIDAATYEDRLVDLQPVEIPPYGNYPGTKSVFLRGSVIHPAQFGVALDTQTPGGETLYVSDFFRFHAWPDEWTIPFKNGFCMALSGSTVLVFTRWTEAAKIRGEVYAVGGQNPEHLAKYLVSADHPILSKTSLCRIGQTIFYATHDGLAAVTGGNIQIVTRGHFTRQQWNTLGPSTMSCATADNSIFVAVSGGDYLRLDLDEELKALTRYTALTGVPFQWRSKVFWSKDPLVFDWAIVAASGPVTLTIRANGAQVYTGTVSNTNPVNLGGLTHARKWEFEVSGTAEVTAMQFYERTVHTITDEVRLTAATSPIWRATRLRFADRDAFCLGYLSVQTAPGGAVDVKFSDDSGAVVHTQTVTSGRVFTLPRTLPKSTTWIVDVNAAAAIDELWLMRRLTVQSAGVVRETAGGPFPPWLARRYEFADGVVLRSLLVHASDYTGLTLNLYKDGSATPTTQVAVPNGNEVRLAPAEYQFLEFDFAGMDGRIHEVTIFAGPGQVVDDRVTLLNPANVRGLVYRFAEPNAFACAIVGAASYAAVTLVLKADGVEVYNGAVTGAEVFQLPRTLPRAVTWEVDVQASVPLESLVLVPWRRVAAGEVGVQYVHGEGTIPPWMFTIYEFPNRVTFRSGRVKAYSYFTNPPANTEPLTLRLYPDGAAAPALELDLEDRYEWRLDDDDVVACETLCFDFDDNSEVQEVRLYPEEHIPVEGGGVILRQAPAGPWRNKVLSFRDVGNFDVGRVYASDYTGLRMDLLVAGLVKDRLTPSSSEEFKVGAGAANYRDWQLDLDTQGEVRELHLMARVHYLVQDGRVVIRRENDPFSWLQKRILCPRPVNFAALRVAADAYNVVVRLYDMDGDLAKTITVTDGEPVRLQKLRPERIWTIDVAPASATTQIHEVGLAVSMAALAG